MLKQNNRAWSVQRIFAYLATWANKLASTWYTFYSKEASNQVLQIITLNIKYNGLEPQVKNNIKFADLI